ncbi:hypothetical protein ElyMa_003288800 [Elysia marginata]|uniref:Uncharacterized protein n=1 Tax=Elysia marginata TaxID=1093978 RepID=A0AAV4JC74_9GAST|nr:hypothetical protein ElyMa_003288800 [Elysia marginata]
MVRLGIYDYANNGADNKDTKHHFAFDFYTKARVISPYSLDAIGESVKAEGNGDNSKDVAIDVKDGESVDTGNGVDGEPEDLGQVWRNFLSETSLHGCKNIKERQIIKR